MNQSARVRATCSGHKASERLRDVGNVSPVMPCVARTPFVRLHIRVRTRVRRRQTDVIYIYILFTTILFFSPFVPTGRTRDASQMIRNMTARRSPVDRGDRRGFLAAVRHVTRGGGSRGCLTPLLKSLAPTWYPLGKSRETLVHHRVVIMTSEKKGNFHDLLRS